jgi:hypothetical protein
VSTSSSDHPHSLTATPTIVSKIHSSLTSIMFAKSIALASVLSTALAGSIPLIHTRSTLPDVTIKALPAGCTSYPGYNTDSQTAGPWSMIVSDSENPDLLNFGPSNTYSLAIDSRGRPVMRWGYVRTHTLDTDKLNVLTCKFVGQSRLPFWDCTQCFPMHRQQAEHSCRHQRQRCWCSRKRKVDAYCFVPVPI